MSKNIRKIKVVHIISSLKIGGAEAVLVDLLRTLGNQYYEHHVLYFHAGNNVARIQELGIATYAIKGLFFRYDVGFFIRLYHLIKVIKPDIIHSSLWAANFMARIVGFLLGIPTICAVHLGVETDGRVRNILDHYTLNFATHLVAISNNVAESLYNRWTWLKPARISVIKNGIDKEYVLALKTQFLQQRVDYAFSGQHIVIGSVGRFIERKNFPMLIEVFKILQSEYTNTRLMLVGQGPQENELRFLVRSLGLQEVVTFVTGKMAYGYYSLMDIFVLPSFQEGLSIALLEAMSCGLPSIICNSVMQHDVIRHYYNGIIAPISKEGLLIELKNVVNDQFLRSKLSLNARTTIEQSFSVQTMAQAYEQLYKKTYSNLRIPTLN